MSQNTTPQKINFQRIMIEVVSIIFAVLAALAVDAWRDNLSRQNDVKAATTSIINEIKSNLASTQSMLKSNTKNYERLLEQVKAYNDNKNIENPPAIDTGMTVAELSHVAWAITKNNQVSGWFKLDVLLRIGRVYHEQTLLETQIKSFREFSLSRDPDISRIKVARYYLRFLSEMNMRAEELIELYQGILKEIEPQ